jgi:hypothetical protein
VTFDKILKACMVTLVWLIVAVVIWQAPNFGAERTTPGIIMVTAGILGTAYILVDRR